MIECVDVPVLADLSQTGMFLVFGAWVLRTVMPLLELMVNRMSYLLSNREVMTSD